MSSSVLELSNVTTRISLAHSACSLHNSGVRRAQQDKTFVKLRDEAASRGVRGNRALGGEELHGT